MNITRKKLSLIIVLILIINIFIFALVNQEFSLKYEFNFDVKSNEETTIRVYYSEDDLLRDDKVYEIRYLTVGELENYKVIVPDYTQYVTIVALDKGEVSAENIHAKYLWEKYDINDDLIEKNKESNNITINIGKLNIDDKIIDIYNLQNLAYKLIYCIIIDLIVVVFVKYSKKIMTLPIELIHDRRLIFNLAKNDFKTKYAGSYLGIIWAFIQPIITVLIYWFVFQVGFKSAPIKDFPFVLWLIAGIVPWFFFNESLLNSTNSLLEYSYLVKKVVFKVSILPLVKIISALFVHLFFILLAIFIYALNGYMPTMFLIQVIYYSFCTFMLSLSLSYATSAIVLFFKDLGQIVNILLQIGMWLTPIMWSFTMIPEKYQWILKLNPMYYASEGYRDAFINHVWFFEKFNQTIYFWIVTMFLFLAGALIFKRLKPHFADVL